MSPKIYNGYGKRPRSKISEPKCIWGVIAKIVNAARVTLSNLLERNSLRACFLAFLEITKVAFKIRSEIPGKAIPS